MVPKSMGTSLGRDHFLYDSTIAIMQDRTLTMKIRLSLGHKLGIMTNDMYEFGKKKEKKERLTVENEWKFIIYILG